MDIERPTWSIILQNQNEDIPSDNDALKDTDYVFMDEKPRNHGENGKKSKSF